MKYKAHKWLAVVAIVACLGCSNEKAGDNSASQGDQPVASDEGGGQPEDKALHGRGFRPCGEEFFRLLVG